MDSRLTAALLASCVLASVPASAQRTVNVTNATELTNALADAMPGDDIVLADGDYSMGDRVRTSASGTAAMSIRVRASNPHGATIQFGGGGGVTEGFVVANPYWTFEDLRLEGVCASHSNCEHAWHIVGGAHFTVIRNNIALDFNAQIKGNGTGDSPIVFPNDVLVEGNEFYNASIRMTGNPVTPIDVVGGSRWVIRANFIHDFAKGMGNGISYAAFLKGDSRDGVIERNLIVCESLHTGRTRLGLSFGGGGTGGRFCTDGVCAIEHRNGIMRNNIIAHCPTDVGIYINECSGCEILHNTLFDTGGIDLRFATTSVTVAGNLMPGRIRDRDGASSTRVDNLENVTAANFNAWFRDPAAFDFGLVSGSTFVDMGTTLALLPDDFCGNDRSDGSPDIGAVEYDGDGPCDTTMIWLGMPSTPGADAGPGGADAGPDADAGTGPGDSSVPTGDSGVGGSDAGATSSDGGPLGLDGGLSADAGTSGTSDGCGCSTVGVAGSSGLGLWIVLLALAGIRRSRQR